MCGICGILSLDGAPVDRSNLTAMVRSIHHRGPDDSGVWSSGAVGLGSTRLAILDISPAGHMPMSSPDGQLQIVYNGESYNYPALRTQLLAQGLELRSHSDTEALLHLYRQYGSEFARHLRGMFAFGLWDVSRQSLLLGRDRLGKKPLYYAFDGKRLVFGSEIKAILASGLVERQFASEYLPHYLTYGYSPTPNTLFRGVYSLPPAHLLEISLENPQPRLFPYWEPPFPSAQLRDGRDPREWQAQLLEQLREAVRLRLLSDVPLGAFLSGGVDSSLVVALMQEANSQPVKTFAIGFPDDPSFNEAPYARQVAQRLGTQHHELLVTPDAVSLLPQIVAQLDQPFADSSCIPTLLVSQFARQHVTVALTGDGGDELFGGYERFRAARLADQIRLPGVVHSGLLQLLEALPHGTGYRNLPKRAARFLRRARLPLPERYLGWVGILSPDTAAAWCAQPTTLVTSHFSSQFRQGWAGDPLPHLLDINLRTYLLDDLLVKVDRMSMAASLEARSPLLDHLLVEFVSALPLDLKLNGKTGKWLLRETLAEFLPRSLFERPKHGFGVPLGKWFRDSLRQTLQEYLLPAQPRYARYIERAAVVNTVQSHLSGQKDHAHLLWALLTLEVWLQNYF